MFDHPTGHFKVRHSSYYILKDVYLECVRILIT